MYSKIKKSFRNSRFYRNYNNIDNVILQFEKIKISHTKVKTEHKKKLIHFINIMIQNNSKELNIKKYISFLVNKYGVKCIKIELNTPKSVFTNSIKMLFYKNMTDKIFLCQNYKFICFLEHEDIEKNKIKKYSRLKFVNKWNICNKILGLKTFNGHDIKKYIIYSDNINKIFINSFKVGSIKNINTLIKRGYKFDLDIDYCFGRNWSYKNVNIDFIKFLLKKYNHIHRWIDVLLRSLIVYGNVEIVKFLVEKGADIHYDDNYALRYSSEKGFFDLVKYLVEKGVNIHSKENYSLLYSSSNGHIEIVKYLVKNGADIHFDDDIALRWSTNNNQCDVVKFLIENGANIHAKDNFAIKNSSRYGRIDITKYLVEKGANIHVDDDYALKWSNYNGHVEIVKFLINSDLEYYCKNKIAKNIVIKNNLIEFYEKFDIK